MKEYDHGKVEKKWQKVWENKKIYKTLPAKIAKKKNLKPYYVLDMFPYPSGVGLHVGHPRGYIASDVYARMKRMQGFNVLHPMGFDSFGLPAEQYAIKTGKHPGPFTDTLIKQYRKQLENLGFSYDWSREVSTHKPEYYKWTQWIFLKLYNAWYDKNQNKARDISELITIFETSGNEKVNAVNSEVSNFSAKDWKAFSDLEKQKMLMSYRLAYEGYAEVNWCPELGTVLANDEILEKDGKLISERGDYPVEKKNMRQWFMRITAYADRLINGLETINWPSSIKEIQKNWIGRSDGAELSFAIKGTSEKVSVFTTRPDTLYGVTYVVLSPEHSLVQKLKDNISNWNEVNEYVQKTAKKDELSRISDDKEKTGVEVKGLQAINPINQESVPVFIADYVLSTYGTGAIMAVPAHDERDLAFAKKYNLPVKQVIDNDVLINSDKFNGLNSEKAKIEITKTANGKIVTKYKMRDAIFARQRYWGEPIPLIHSEDGIINTVEEKKLPLILPKVKSYQPSGTGESPLSKVKAWMKAGYETNTMPGWAGSSWYFLRYMDPKNKKSFADKEELEYWGGVDMYIGGQEHATGHLLYSRFWHKALKDLGFINTEEPFKTLRNQGMILGSDSRKMSKRWGNVINPDEIVKTYGADTMRVYEMFMGPFEQSLPWSTENIIGSRRFVERVWRLKDKVSKTTEINKDIEAKVHQTIEKVTKDIETMNFNTAISSLMILVNELDSVKELTIDHYQILLCLLAPFAPYMTDELWNDLGNKTSIHISNWPVYIAEKAVKQKVNIVIQVNGKVRSQLSVEPHIDQKSMEELALKEENVIRAIDKKEIKKVIFVPKKIINFVV